MLTSMIYKISCKSCDKVIEESNSNSESPNYIGLTRASLHARMSSHLDGQRRSLSGNPLHRHDLENHNGQKQVYICKPVASEKKIVRLYMNEALRIEKQDRSASINDKMECGRGGLVRISATRVTN